MRSTLAAGCLLAAVLAGCGEREVRTVIPGDEPVYFLVEGRESTESKAGGITNVEGPFRRDDAPSFETALSDGEVLVYVGFDEDSIPAALDRVDASDIGALDIRRASESTTAQPQCAASGFRQRDSMGNTSGIELDLDVALGGEMPAPGIHVLDSGRGTFERADRFPLAAEGWSLMGAAAPCLPDWTIEVERFRPEGPRPTPDFGLAALHRLDDDHVLAIGTRQLLVYERGLVDPIAELNTAQGQDDPGYYWIQAGDILRDPDGQGGLILFLVRWLNPAVPRDMILFSTRYRSGTFTPPQPVFSTPVEPDDADVRALHLEPDGRMIALGRHMMIVATSTNGPFIVHNASAYSFTNSAWTSPPQAPALLTDYAGGFWEGDPTGELTDMRVSEPFSSPKPIYGIAVSDSGDRVYLASDESRFVVGQRDAWRELELVLPDDALACSGPVEPVCGERLLRSSIGNGVRKIRLIEDETEGDVLLIQSESCYGVFLGNPRRECIQAAPLGTPSVEFAGRELHGRLDWAGKRGIYMSRDGDVFEIRVSRADSAN